MEALRTDGGNGLVDMVDQVLREGHIRSEPGWIEPEDDAVALFCDEVLAILLWDRGLTIPLVLGLNIRKIEYLLFLVVQGEVER